MKVLMLRGLSGPNGVLRKGEVYDLPDPKAINLLNNKLASPVKQIREVALTEPEDKAITDVQDSNTASKRTVKPRRSKRSSKGNG